MDAIPPVDHFSFGKDKKCRKTCYNKLKFQAEDDGGKTVGRKMQWVFIDLSK